MQLEFYINSGHLMTLIRLLRNFKGRRIQANISTVDNMSAFSFSCICDLVEFYGAALMLLAARMNCYGRGGMRAVVFPASFS
jgi:hypothetical protein